ncbi:unnamed protein product [Colias eurytheme]|nr:unnamed protein product [Colias eurytheme]
MRSRSLLYRWSVESEERVSAVLVSHRTGQYDEDGRSRVRAYGANDNGAACLRCERPPKTAGCRGAYTDYSLQYTDPRSYTDSIGYNQRDMNEFRCHMMRLLLMEMTARL